MPKIVYVMIGMLALTIALQVFSCSTWDASGACVGSDANSLISFLMNPTSVNSSEIFDIFFGSKFGLLAGAGFTALIIAGFYSNRNENYIYLAMAVGLVSSLYPVITLWTRIAESSLFPDVPARIIATLIAGTLLGVVIFSIIDWSRGRD